MGLGSALVPAAVPKGSSWASSASEASLAPVSFAHLPRILGRQEDLGNGFWLCPLSSESLEFFAVLAFGAVFAPGREMNPGGTGATASGFYEWQKVDGAKVLIRQRDVELWWDRTPFQMP